MYTSDAANLGAAGGIDNDCEACVDKSVSYKTVQFPCTRSYQQMVTSRVGRQVPVTAQVEEKYMTTEQVAVQKPVTQYVNRTTYKTVNQAVPVETYHTVMEDFTMKKKIPKTTWVEVDVNYKRPVQKKVMTTRTVQKQVPEVRAEPVQTMRTVYMNRPVERSRMVNRTINKTVYEDVQRPVCRSETKMCSTRVPVYKVTVRPPGQCRPRGITENFNQVDTNNDGVIDRQEFANAQTRAAAQPAASSGRHVPKGCGPVSVIYGLGPLRMVAEVGRG